MPLCLDFFAILILISACNTRTQTEREIIDTHFHAFNYDEYGFPPPPNEVTGVIPTSKIIPK